MRGAWAVALLLLVASAARAGDAAMAPERKAAIDAACQVSIVNDVGPVMDRRCVAALAFDTRAYFGPGTVDDSDTPGGLVDAHYTQTFRGQVWAFAIDEACPGLRYSDARCPDSQRRWLMRAVTIGDQPPPTKWVGKPPLSEGDMRRFLSVIASWREADLLACPGAAKTLDSLGKIRLPAFDDATRRRIEGRPPSHWVVVTADPDSVTVRAGSLVDGFSTHDIGEPGTAGDWAKRMMAVARPCLKPTPVPAPWAEPAP